MKYPMKYPFMNQVMNPVKYLSLFQDLIKVVHSVLSHMVLLVEDIDYSQENGLSNLEDLRQVVFLAFVVFLLPWLI